MSSGHLLLSCAKRAATTKIDLFAYLWQLPCALCSLILMTLPLCVAAEKQTVKHGGGIVMLQKVGHAAQGEIIWTDGWDIKKASNAQTTVRHLSDTGYICIRETERLDSCQTAGTRYIRRIQSGKRCRNTSPATVVWNLSAKNTRFGQQVNSEAG